MMLLRLLVTMIGLAVLMGQGCPQPAPPPPPSCLTIDDVIGIPAGNGQGAAFSGVYRPVSVVEDECTQCDKNVDPRTHCDPPTLDTSGVATFTQQDGVLTITATGQRPASGTIDADGSFKIGIIGTPSNSTGVSTGQALAIMEGRFVGNRIIATMTVRITTDSPQENGGAQDSQQVTTATYELAQ